MAIDTVLLAMPEGSALFQRILQEPSLQEPNLLLRLYRDQPIPGETLPWDGLFQDLKQARPSVFTRVYREQHRSWGAIHDFVSEKFRNESGVPEWVHRIFRGVSLPGFSEDEVSWVDANSIALAEAQLSTIDDRSFLQWWKPSDLNARGVYKIHPESSSTQLESIVDDFDQFRGFLSQVRAQSDECFLIFRF